MKKILFSALCIALIACLFTGCEKSKDMDMTTDTAPSTTTTPTTSGTHATMPPSPTLDEILPTAESTAPSQEASETPSTVAPNGGTANDSSEPADASRRSMNRR